jgi:hypothetical protein
MGMPAGALRASIVDCVAWHDRLPDREPVVHVCASFAMPSDGYAIRLLPAGWDGDALRVEVQVVAPWRSRPLAVRVVDAHLALAIDGHVPAVSIVEAGSIDRIRWVPVRALVAAGSAPAIPGVRRAEDDGSAAIRSARLSL